MLEFVNSDKHTQIIRTWEQTEQIEHIISIENLVHSIHIKKAKQFEWVLLLECAITFNRPRERYWDGTEGQTFQEITENLTTKSFESYLDFTFITSSPRYILLCCWDHRMATKSQWILLAKWNFMVYRARIYNIFFYHKIAI